MIRAGSPDSSISFLYNVRINSKVRMDRLLASLNQVISVGLFPISLRVRGTYAEEITESICDESITLYKNHNFRAWKLNLLEQVLQSPSSFFVLMQEDHSLVCDEAYLKDCLLEFASLNLDFMPISFLPQYGHLKNLISKNRITINEMQHLKFVLINRKVARSLRASNNYLLNLVGIYKRELLVRILMSNRPVIKHFASDAPFDFEQRPSQKWFLPIYWALPNREIFACIDDDHGIQGYSLISRRLHRNDAKRTIEHHDFSKLDKTTKFFSPIKSSKIQKILRITKYTMTGLFHRFTSKKHIRSITQRANSLLKSSGPE